MNRKEKRNQKKKKGSNLVELDLFKQKARERYIIKTATGRLMGLHLHVLHDEFGFGKKRLSKFVNATVKMTKAMVNGDFTDDELIQNALEEFNIRI